MNYLDAYHKDVVYRKDINHVVTATEKQIRKCSICKGDVFFTPTSETPDDIARCCIAGETMTDVVYSYHIVRFRPKIELNSRYLACACNAEDFRVQAQSSCVGSGTRYVITLPKFAEMEIDLPPIKQQTEIACAFDSIDAHISAISALIAKYEAIKKATVNLLLKPKTGWRRVKLGDVTETSSGGTPSRNEDSYYQGSIPWFTTSELCDESLYDRKEGCSAKWDTQRAS